MYGMFGRTKFVVKVKREDTRSPKEYTVWAKSREDAEDRAIGKACVREACSERFLEVTSIREAAR